MFRSIEQFKKYWNDESGNTRKLFSSLTDSSLKQEIAPGHRNLGQLAWHITQSISEMGCKTGLSVSGPPQDAPVPNSADEIRKAYDLASSTLLSQISEKWNDSTLQVEDDLYGFKWKRGLTLHIIMVHEIHHRAQMTVLMRQAGLYIPGMYGPSKEEWASMGMKPPEI